MHNRRIPAGSHYKPVQVDCIHSAACELDDVIAVQGGREFYSSESDLSMQSWHKASELLRVRVRMRRRLDIGYRKP
jgi:hypothetical protein